VSRHLSDIGALELAREAYELTLSHPDFIYQPPPLGDDIACVYVHDGEGSCLFGQAFVNLGVDPEELLGINVLGIDNLIDAEDDTFADVQGAQDVGVAWGDESVQDKLRRYIEAYS
jgi:hypothetical protein